MEKWTVWKDRSNPIDLTITDYEGTTYSEAQIGLITKIELKYKSQYYDSSILASVFDFTTKASSGIVIVKPGLMGWGAGSDIVEIVIYDDGDSDGRVMGQVAVIVKDDAEKIL